MIWNKTAGLDWLLWPCCVFLLALVGSCATMIGTSVEDAPDIKVEATPQRLQRGEYLALNVTRCIDCHSKRNFDYYSGPVVEGTEGQGGECFDEKTGFPGRICATNITPFELGKWTDGELARAITTGVGKDGRANFPIMPYKNYAMLTTEDLYSIIAYIRTLKPIESQTPERELNFPLEYVVRTMPEPYKSQPMPEKSDKLAYGKYMTTIAGCGDCHTMREKGVPIEGMELAGGVKFPFGNGNLTTSTNLTPHEESGIGAWEVEDLYEVFQRYGSEDAKKIPVVRGGRYRNTTMPWTSYSKMTEEDLAAIFAYLKSQKPVDHMVNPFSYAE